jgi:hypothetical protein
MRLFFLLLGVRPPGRHTEQHDVFFGIGKDLADLVQDIKAFWPEGGSALHVDAWRTVTKIDDHRIEVSEKNSLSNSQTRLKLFFLNLGGYKRGLFDELHFKYLCVSENKATAVQSGKKTAFYKEAGFPGARSHIDEKFALDVDDIYEISDILPASQKEKYQLNIHPVGSEPEDEIHLGYFKLNKL